MDSWSGILERHGPAVWRVAYRLLGNEADADDVYQEVFIEAVRLSRTKKVENWGALLHRIVTRRALDQLRQRLRQKDRQGSMPPNDVPSPNRGPMQQAQAAELAEELRSLLLVLPTKQATAFCLRHLDDLSYDEIAQAMEVPANEVGVLIHRAKMRLHEMFQEAEVHND